jgi:hypothetical protein
VPGVGVEMYEFNANASSFPSEMSLVIATERPELMKDRIESGIITMARQMAVH